MCSVRLSPRGAAHLERAARGARRAVAHGQADDEILDRYAEQRRRAFLEYASPAASDLKRLIYHPKDRAAVEGAATMLRQVAADSKLRRDFFMRAKKCETPSLLG
jgi:3-(3-hydroxy-phenyl)propionate hydroxylase